VAGRVSRKGFPVGLGIRYPFRFTDAFADATERDFASPCALFLKREVSSSSLKGGHAAHRGNCQSSRSKGSLFSATAMVSIFEPTYVLATIPQLSMAT
jgi:hypothetical protein